jgi:RecA/RadA recombinase
MDASRRKMSPTVQPVEVQEEAAPVEDIDMEAIRKRMNKLVTFSSFEQRLHFILKTQWEHLHRVLGGPDGIPYGKMIELHGLEHGGKTLIGQILMGEAQRDGAAAIHLDNEESADEVWETKLGVDYKNVLLIQPKMVDSITTAQKKSIKEKVDKMTKLSADEQKAKRQELLDKLRQENPPRLQSAQELFEETEKAVIALHEAGRKKIFVLIDSIANMTTLKQLEAGTTGQSMNTVLDLAAFLSTVLKKWAGLAANYNAMVVVINQLRAQPRVLFGDPMKTPAGQALKHACGNRCRVRRLKSGQLKHGGHVVGIVGIIRNVKNKMGGGSVEGEQCGFMVIWKKAKARIEFMTAEEAEAMLRGERE